MWSAETLASGISYHANGDISAMSFGNGQLYSMTLNSRQLMGSTKTYKPGMVTAIDSSFTYDGNGRMTAMTNHHFSSIFANYSYDGFGRLTAASGPWGNASYSYDPMGNMLTKTIGSRTITNTYKPYNLLTQSQDSELGTRTVWRDSRGNYVRLGGQYFTYDMSDQPVSISGDVSGSYVYDGATRP